MPNENPTVRVEWNDENLEKVLSEIYAEAATNETLRAQLISNPTEVLSTRINVPEAYIGGIFSRVRGEQIIMLYVPPLEASGEQAREATTEVDQKPNYEIICSVVPPW